jgi:hypothetical protein
MANIFAGTAQYLPAWQIYLPAQHNICQHGKYICRHSSIFASMAKYYLSSILPAQLICAPKKKILAVPAKWKIANI